jgi:hypothetical protein
MTRRQKVITLTCLITVVVVLLASTQLSIVVIQPIGALPEGRTLVVSRLTNTKLVDSPDAICQRLQGGVSLLCRAMVMGEIAEEATIYLRLPYSKRLYSLSTDGAEYEE